MRCSSRASCAPISITPTRHSSAVRRPSWSRSPRSTTGRSVPASPGRSAGRSPISSPRRPPARSTATRLGTSTSATEPSVDLNADLGEGFGRWSLGDDEALLAIVSSANVACGFHAGDGMIMYRVCVLAREYGVTIGAHVSYRDLAGFGRRFIDVPSEELSADILYQIGALDGIARAAGTRVYYVKAHGALYNRAHTDPEHAQALVDAVSLYGGDLALLCQPGSEVERLAHRHGLLVVPEAFPDRGYQASGALVPRGEVAARAVRMAESGEVETPDGELVSIAPESLCVHGDGPNAVAASRATRDAL